MQHMPKLLKGDSKAHKLPILSKLIFVSAYWSSPSFLGWHRVAYWHLSVTPSELGHSGASSFREYNCWEKSS